MKIFPRKGPWNNFPNRIKVFIELSALRRNKYYRCQMSHTESVIQGRHNLEL